MLLVVAAQMFVADQFLLQYETVPVVKGNRGPIPAAIAGDCRGQAGQGCYLYQLPALMLVQIRVRIRSIFAGIASRA
ncbi:hypothetical protein D3C84_1000480 [compost metagenome]